MSRLGGRASEARFRNPPCHRSNGGLISATLSLIFPILQGQFGYTLPCKNTPLQIFYPRVPEELSPHFGFGKSPPTSCYLPLPRPKHLPGGRTAEECILFYCRHRSGFLSRKIMNSFLSPCLRTVRQFPCTGTLPHSSRCAHVPGAALAAFFPSARVSRSCRAPVASGFRPLMGARTLVASGFRCFSLVEWKNRRGGGGCVCGGGGESKEQRQNLTPPPRKIARTGAAAPSGAAAAWPRWAAT